MLNSFLRGGGEASASAKIVGVYANLAEFSGFWRILMQPQRHRDAEKRRGDVRPGGEGEGVAGQRAEFERHSSKADPRNAPISQIWAVAGHADARSASRREFAGRRDGRQGRRPLRAGRVSALEARSAQRILRRMVRTADPTRAYASSVSRSRGF